MSLLFFLRFATVLLLLTQITAESEECDARSFIEEEDSCSANNIAAADKDLEKWFQEFLLINPSRFVLLYCIF